MKTEYRTELKQMGMGQEWRVNTLCMNWINIVIELLVERIVSNEGIILPKL